MVIEGESHDSILRSSATLKAAADWVWQSSRRSSGIWARANDAANSGRIAAHTEGIFSNLRFGVELSVRPKSSGRVPANSETIIRCVYFASAPPFLPSPVKTSASDINGFETLWAWVRPQSTSSSSQDSPLFATRALGPSALGFLHHSCPSPMRPESQGLAIHAKTPSG